MRKVLITAALALAPVLAAPALAAEPAAPAAAKLSVETTDLGTLLDNAGAKAVLTKHVPDLIGNEQIAMARGMTLKQLQGFAGDALTDEKLAAIQADLDKLPPA